MASREAVETWTAAAIAALLTAGALAAVTHGTHHPIRTASAPAPAVSSPTAPTTPATPATPALAAKESAAGDQVLRDDTDHLSIAVPAGWQSPALAQGSYADMVQAFATRNPQFSPLISQRVARTSATVGLFAVDPRSHTTLVIQSATAAPGVLTGASATGVLPSQLIAQYEKLGIQVFNTATIQLPLGPVLHASLGLLVAGKELTASQYFLVDGAKAITITIEGPPGADNLAVHERIALSAHRTT